MSTKTTFKRIALVAVAALALGGLSAVPANAVIHTVTAPIYLSKNSQAGGVVAPMGTTADVNGNSYTKGFITNSVSSVSLNVGDTFTPVIYTSGGSDTFSTLDIIDMSINGVLVQSENASNTTLNYETMTTYTVPTTAGTYTGVITYYQTATTRGAADFQATMNFTLVVRAASAYSNALSTSYINAGSNAAVGSSSTDAIPVAGTKSVAVLPVAIVSVALKNAAGAATGGALTNTVNATVSGPGFVKWATTGTDAWSGTGCTSATSRSENITATAAANSFFICGDGTAGVSTITIKVTDAAGAVTTLGTKTVTFFGSASKLAATVIYSVAKAGGGTVGVNTAARTASTVIPAVIVKATDSNGAVVGGLTIQLSSSDGTIVNSDSSGACNADTPNDAVDTNKYSSGGVGYYNCKIVTPASATSGKTATLTWRIIDPAGDGTTYLTAATPITIGGSIKTQTVTLDASSYTAGGPMSITTVAKDSSGNTPYDGQLAFGDATTSNKGATGLPSGTTQRITAGKWTSTANTVFAPVTSGDFTLIFTGGDSALTEITAVASVEGDQSSSLALDAANAATDAANNAYDEAQNATQAASDALAAVTALAAQVTDLIASVKKLTAAVAKLSKKK